MTPREWLDVLGARWRSVLAGLLLGLLVGVVVSLLLPPTYRASTTIFVSARSPGGDVAAAAEGGELSAQRMATYLEVLRSHRLATQVAERHGGGLTPDEVLDKIDASTTPDTLLLTATVADSSPQRAADLANLLAEQFNTTVAALEQPDPQAPPVVTARTFEPAVVPTSPSGPRPLLVIGICLGLGLLAGIALALARHALDRSITSRDQARRSVDAPVLGLITDDRDVQAHRLVFRDRPRGRVAEEFRRLRANLQAVAGPDAHRTVLVTGTGPEEGTTTTACNLALALADAGERVLVVEADFRRPRAADLFGVDRTVGLANVLAGRLGWPTAVHRWQDTLDVLPSGPPPPNPSELLAQPVMDRLLADVRARYDVVIIDSPPVGAVSDASVLAPRVDGVVLVLRSGKTTTAAAEDAATALETVSARLLGTVLTMTRGRAGVADDDYLATGAGTGYAVGPWSVAPSTTPPATPAPTAPPRAQPPPAPEPSPPPPVREEHPTEAVLATGARRPSPRPRPRPEGGDGSGAR
ncbi:MAG TPA: polysaccharide biosynthesis tyrosine autokinase [Pseudonocardia sp.]|uniref:polysaccharide biosynthesis tyrosine autokinase n=1 Tax=Pseudonocardia sp. TaxID=60912 RepID=UPI002B4B62E7|nr:polysaccharide biosynthesis tyrosine autokinase [Pseudonocardia sp.]HLU59341.1 polysaccharide biosynthesis tyrosine autokinase [Pseudonocardia sp.]